MSGYGYTSSGRMGDVLDFVYHHIAMLGSHSKRGARVRTYRFCAGLNYCLAVIAGVSDYHFEHTFVSSSGETLPLDDLGLICGTPQELSLTPFERSSSSSWE